MLDLLIVNSSAEAVGKDISGWISCPFTNQEWEELMVHIKLGTIDEKGEYRDGYADGDDLYDEYYIGDVDTDLIGATFSKYDSPFDISYACERIEKMTSAQKNGLKALIDKEDCRGVEELDMDIDRIESGRVSLSSCASVYDVAKDDVESGAFSPEFISDFIDYDKLVSECYSNYSATKYGILALE